MLVYLQNETDSSKIKNIKNLEIHQSLSHRSCDVSRCDMSHISIQKRVFLLFFQKKWIDCEDLHSYTCTPRSRWRQKTLNNALCHLLHSYFFCFFSFLRKTWNFSLDFQENVLSKKFQNMVFLRFWRTHFVFTTARIFVIFDVAC